MSVSILPARVSAGEDWEIVVAHFFKFKEIGLTLELPQASNVVRRVPRLARPPVFDEARFVRRNDTVIVWRILFRVSFWWRMCLTRLRS